VPNTISSRKPTEIDFILVHEHGICVIEVKNHRGTIIGSEKNAELTQAKLSNSNYLYEDAIKNPVKQLHWQIRTLKSYLKQRGFHVWIDGYVVFSHPNCELDIKGRTNIITLNELDETILVNKKPLDAKVIRALEQVLSKL